MYYDKIVTKDYPESEEPTLVDLLPFFLGPRPLPERRFRELETMLDLPVPSEQSRAFRHRLSWILGQVVHRDERLNPAKRESGARWETERRELHERYAAIAQAAQALHELLGFTVSPVGYIDEWPDFGRFTQAAPGDLNALWRVFAPDVDDEDFYDSGELRGATPREIDKHIALVHGRIRDFAATLRTLAEHAAGAAEARTPRRRRPGAPRDEVAAFLIAYLADVYQRMTGRHAGRMTIGDKPAGPFLDFVRYVYDWIGGPYAAKGNEAIAGDIRRYAHCDRSIVPWPSDPAED